MAKSNLLKNILPHRLIGVTLVLSAMTAACSNPAQTGQQGPPAFPVQVQPIESSTVQESSEFVGALEAQKKVALQPAIDGRIIQVLVASGDRVTAGTPIVQLKAERTEAEATGAVADVEAAQAARGTALAQVRAAEANRQRAAADLQLQNTEFQRTQSLVAEGAQSQQALDRATNSRNTATAALRAAEEDVGAARASLAEAEARLSRAQADRSATGADLRESRVVAPIDGVVGNVAFKVGDYVTTSSTITNIIQNQTLDLNLSVPIERSPRLRLGLPVQLIDEQNKPLATGQISFISPQVNQTEQSVLAKASFANGGRLRDGQFVRARLIWNSQAGILVPTTAVTRVAGKTFIYVAEAGKSPESGEPQQIARQRPVELGAIQGNSYQVRSGLKAGDQIIVSGILNLTDGVPITTAQPGSPTP